MNVITKMNEKVDPYFINGCGRCPLGGTPQCKVNSWHVELQLLRKIILECGLTEELKWSVPCYTVQEKNILILAAFKEYVAISFFNGALLQNSFELLIQPTENVQAGRQLRFTNLEDIIGNTSIIKTYIYDAIAVEKAGNKVQYKQTSEFPIPPEFQTKLDDFPALRTAFEALTPGRQRGYLLHFAAPKLSKTRTARIEKWTPHILNGKGIHD